MLSSAFLPWDFPTVSHKPAPKNISNKYSLRKKHCPVQVCPIHIRHGSLFIESQNHRITGSQNHGMVWAGRHLKDCLPWAGMSPTWLGYSGPHPTWPRRLPGMGNTTVSFLASLLSGFCFKIFLPKTSVTWWMSGGILALMRWHSRKRFFLCLNIVLRRKHCLCSAQHCNCAKSFMNP